MPSSAADRVALLKNMPGADIDAVGNNYVVAVPASFAAPSPTEDPRHHWQFAQVACVYTMPALGTQSAGLRRVVTVHYQPEDRVQALRTTRLIARLLDLYKQHFQQSAVFHLTEDTADVYLAQELSPVEATIGGETHSSQVYVYGTKAIPRSSIEWVRTIAHEWGHLTLAAARGFSEPENDAAGYLGERLYLKWLRTDQATKSASFLDGTTISDLELYDHRQIEPLMERFTAGGPGSPTLDGATGTAMDYYIGAVLQTDDAFGSRITGRALETVLDVHPRDFLVALRHIVAESESFTVRPPAWIPLSRGQYTMAVSPVPGASASTSKTSVSVTGWRHMNGINGDIGTLTFTRVNDRTK